MRMADRLLVAPTTRGMRRTGAVHQAEFGPSISPGSTSLPPASMSASSSAVMSASVASVGSSDRLFGGMPGMLPQMAWGDTPNNVLADSA
ncbi:MAG: hypothetical protein JWL72_4693, partial [Ilumatobacteraceae bacterium]|nr:hypothetical protein [Ilumatobacteraceae bacterium]